MFKLPFITNKTECISCVPTEGEGFKRRLVHSVASTIMAYNKVKKFYC